MKICWVSLIVLLSLALGSCGPSQTVVEDSLAPAQAGTNIVSPIPPDATYTTTAGVIAAIGTPTVSETAAWKTYHNTQTGFSADYPADWTVNESAGVNGELITSFMAPDDGQGIIVSVLNAAATVEEIPDMPNTRCQQVTISGLPGQRCFDTVASSISTTFSGHGKQYAIAAFGKHPDQNIYRLFLESLTLTP